MSVKVEIKSTGGEWFDIYTDGSFYQDVLGLDEMLRVVHEIFDNTPKPCLNIGELTPCGVGEITSKWEERR